MFVNDGKLGDVVVSSIIIENEFLFEKEKLYFIFSNKYEKLFVNYLGKSEIIFLDSTKFKYNINYRMNFMRKIQKFNVKSVYNISPSRGFVNEYITYFTFSKNKYSFCGDNQYLGNFLIRFLKQRNLKILFDSNENYYMMFISFMKKKFKISEIKINNNILFPFTSEIKNEYILIAPFTSEKIKSWGSKNFIELALRLKEKYKVIITGQKAEIDPFIFNYNGKFKNIEFDFSDLKNIHTLIINSKLVVGNDSGIIHLALKFSVPFLAILYGGYIGKYFPVFQEDIDKNYLYKEEYCFKCTSSRKCIYSNPLCLQSIGVDEVCNKINLIINRIT